MSAGITSDRFPFVARSVSRLIFERNLTASGNASAAEENARLTSSETSVDLNGERNGVKSSRVVGSATTAVFTGMMKPRTDILSSAYRFLRLLRNCAGTAPFRLGVCAQRLVADTHSEAACSSLPWPATPETFPISDDSPRITFFVKRGFIRGV